MKLTLERHTYSPTETMGVLTFGMFQLHILENPWIPDRTHGSRPSESCVPDGEYFLVPHDGTTYANTWALVSPELKVWHLPHQRLAGQGRATCVFHAGNWTRNTRGCLLPGMSRGISRDPHDNQFKQSVSASADAMQALRDLLTVGTSGHTLLIRPTRGAQLHAS